MAENITKIVVRRGTDNQRRTANTTGIQFNIGEPAYVVDTKRLYIGDGQTIGGLPVGTRNLGPVDQLFGTYLTTGFTQVAYNILVSKSAEAGDIIYDRATKTIYALTGYNAFPPLSSDFVKYDSYVVINPTEFYYDNLTLNLQDEGVWRNKLNSNVVDGITLTKISPFDPIQLSPGSTVAGVENTNFKFIPPQSLYLNTLNSFYYPQVIEVGANEFIGRCGTSKLSSYQFSTILPTLGLASSNGIVNSNLNNQTTFSLDTNFFKVVPGAPVGNPVNNNLSFFANTTIHPTLSVTGAMTVSNTISARDSIYGNNITANVFNGSGAGIVANTLPGAAITNNSIMGTKMNVDAITGQIPGGATQDTDQFLIARAGALYKITKANLLTESIVAGDGISVVLTP
jgi:hypothetical protein